MTAHEYALLTVAAVSFAIGSLTGHAAGYLRARHAIRLRIRRRARYRRVGRPE